MVARDKWGGGGKDIGQLQIGLILIEVSNSFLGRFHRKSNQGFFFAFCENPHVGFSQGTKVNVDVMR